jgi:hypothetical protein
MDIFELSGVKPVRDSRHEGVMRRLDDSGYSLVVGLGGQSNAISLMQSLAAPYSEPGKLLLVRSAAPIKFFGQAQ